ncbi:malto-oligosyltrehalose synthase [Streptomyces bambusae]|uniref:malto-oligosyltrehalose synthase n=1 Tax=Streptomyces bambusae TaxID=1550616 RepID=UPI001CFE0562|nr:malto-oligosyltrehalose synthase [Streptomyces bambusae]MCB5165598.1 malto-oligosyltrehalose synthase [Streptomyces bambusae]
MPPTATYRLQLQPEFPFAAAEAAVPYLAALGVSHLHLSPVLEAVPGSSHGYDVVDHTRVRAELGGETGLRALAGTARAHGLGLVLDIVPNHMALPVPERLSRPLWEVLREGPGSSYARWFDIDWAAGGDRLLLPVLHGPLPGELAHLLPDPAAGVLRYRDHEFPLRAGTAHLPLPELLAAQWYRLGWWRLARTELNYRRFFTVSELMGLRVEDPEVFAATHGKVLELLRDGVADGLRIDHPDGLADPAAYLRRLAAETGGRWTVVEKILSRQERLPADWPVAGTTGYDALHRLDGLFADPDGVRALERLHRAYTGAAPDAGGEWAATARRAGAEVAGHDLAAETAALVRLAEPHAAARDHAPWALRTAVRELLLALPVYRPYPGPDAAALLPPAAVAAARAAFAVPAEAAAVDCVRELALGGDAAFAARFAQTAAALRAKALEDRAFYRYAPLLSATEVGGDPARPVCPPAEFHAYCARMARDWPLGGTVLSTHDTKRSGDVRARVSVLSQLPQRWAEFLAAVPAGPDPQLVWTAWQTALGLGGVDRGRLTAALLKGAREAALRTGWTEPDEAYEAQLASYVAEMPEAEPAALAALAADLAPHARVNALGAALLQLTMPGVPEVYQGCEADYRALVDPDNRAPFRPPAPDEKTAVTRAALRLRRARPELFVPLPGRPGPSGGYEPVAVRGPAAGHCLAFVRGGGALTAVTRLSARLAAGGGWRDTALRLPAGRWRAALDGDASRAGAASSAEAASSAVVADPSAAPPEAEGPVSFEGPAWVPLRTLFDVLPVTLLVREYDC